MRILIVAILQVEFLLIPDFSFSRVCTTLPYPLSDSALLDASYVFSSGQIFTVRRPDEHTHSVSPKPHCCSTADWDLTLCCWNNHGLPRKRYRLDVGCQWIPCLDRGWLLHLGATDNSLDGSFCLWQRELDVHFPETAKMLNQFHSLPVPMRWSRWSKELWHFKLKFIYGFLLA